jgi:hypothetical protein
MSNRPNQPWRVTITVSALVLAVNWVHIHGGAQIGSESTYTVVLKETVIGRDGKAREASTQTYAVRSDGSTLVKLGANETGSRRIWFASGVEVMANDRLRRKSTIRKPVGPPRRDPRSGCTHPDISGEKFEGEETVDRYRAAKISRGAMDRTLTTWYALDHGCAQIKSGLGFETGEASGIRLVTLIAGEPEAALFAIPPDYQEGPPSALDEPFKCSPGCEDWRKRMDAD